MMQACAEVVSELADLVITQGKREINLGAIKSRLASKHGLSTLLPDQMVVANVYLLQPDTDPSRMLLSIRQ